MPRYYCDVCCAYLTHDSAPGRKQHNRGFKHRENVQRYYDQFKPEFYTKLQANQVAAQMAGNMQHQHQQPMPHNSLMPPGQDGPVKLPPHMQDMAPPPFVHSGMAPPPHSGMPPPPSILPPMEGLQAGQPPPMFNAPGHQKEPLKGENGASQEGGGGEVGAIGIAPPPMVPTTQGSGRMPTPSPWFNPNEVAQPPPTIG
eukprot:71439_1